MGDETRENSARNTCEIIKQSLTGSEDEDYDKLTFRGKTQRKTLERILECSQYAHPYIQPPHKLYYGDHDADEDGYVYYPKQGYKEKCQQRPMTDYLAGLSADPAEDENETRKKKREKLQKELLKFMYQTAVAVDSLHMSKYAKRRCIILRHICKESLFVEVDGDFTKARLRVVIPVEAEGNRADSFQDSELPCCKTSYDCQGSSIQDDWTLLGTVFVKIMDDLFDDNQDDTADGNSIVQKLRYIADKMKNKDPADSPHSTDLHPYVAAILLLCKEFITPDKLHVFCQPIVGNGQSADGQTDEKCHACLRKNRVKGLYLRSSPDCCDVCCTPTRCTTDCCDVCCTPTRCTTDCCYYCHDCYTVAPLICKRHGPAQAIFGGIALIMYGIKKELSLKKDHIIKAEDTCVEMANEFMSTLAHNRVSNVPYENIKCGPLYYTKPVTGKKGYTLDKTKSPKDKLDEYRKWLGERIGEITNPGSLAVWIVYLGHGYAQSNSNSPNEQEHNYQFHWAPLMMKKDESLISPTDREEFLRSIQPQSEESMNPSSSAPINYFDCSCSSTEAAELAGRNNSQVYAGRKVEFRLNTQRLLCQMLRGGCANNCPKLRADSKDLLYLKDLKSMTREVTQPCRKRDGAETLSQNQPTSKCKKHSSAKMKLIHVVGDDDIVLGFCSSAKIPQFDIYELNSSSGQMVFPDLYSLDLNIFGECFDGNTDPKLIKDHCDLKKLKDEIIKVGDKQIAVFLKSEDRGYSDYSLVMQHDMRAYLQRSSLHYICAKAREVTLRGFCSICKDKVPPTLCQHHKFNTVKLPTALWDYDVDQMFDSKSMRRPEIPNLLMFIAYQIFHDYEEDALKLDSQRDIPESFKTRQAIIDILTGLGMDMNDLETKLAVEESPKNKYAIWQDSMSILQHKYSRQLSYDEDKFILTLTSRDPAPVTESADSGSMSQPPSKRKRKRRQSCELGYGGPDES